MIDEVVEFLRRHGWEAGGEYVSALYSKANQVIVTGQPYMRGQGGVADFVDAFLALQDLIEQPHKPVT